MSEQNTPTTTATTATPPPNCQKPATPVPVTQPATATTTAPAGQKFGRRQRKQH